MLVFIDESGTHLSAGIATIAAVYIEEKVYAQVEREFMEAEQTTGVKNFHWTDEKWAKREQILEHIINSNLTAKIAVLTMNKKTLTEYQIALAHLIVERDIKRVYLDGRQPAYFVNQLKKVLRDKGVHTKKIFPVRRDQASAGIRIADCIAGLMRGHYEHKGQNHEKWYRKLKRAGVLTIEIEL